MKTARLNHRHGTRGNPKSRLVSFTLIESQVAKATTGRQLFSNSVRPFRFASFTLIELLVACQPKLSARRPIRCARFTLIELLVVITIIAILASILLPVLGKAKTAARTTQCRNNFKTLGVSVMMYAEEYEDYFPADPGDSNRWGELLAPYAGSHTGATVTLTFRAEQVTHNAAMCPVYDKTDHVAASLGPHNNVARCQVWYYLTCKPNEYLTRNSAGVLRRFKTPSDTMLIAEVANNYLYNWNQLYYNPRHNNRATYVHADGSVLLARYEPYLLSLNFSPWNHWWVTETRSRAFFGLSDFEQL